MDEAPYTDLTPAPGPLLVATNEAGEPVAPPTGVPGAPVGVGWWVSFDPVTLLIRALYATEAALAESIRRTGFCYGEGDELYFRLGGIGPLTNEQGEPRLYRLGLVHRHDATWLEVPMVPVDP